MPSGKAITYGTARQLSRFISSTAPGSSSLSSTVVIRHLLNVCLGVEDGCVLPPIQSSCKPRLGRFTPTLITSLILPDSQMSARPSPLPER